MSLVHDGPDTIGKFILHDGKLIKPNNLKIVPEQAKLEFLKSLLASNQPQVSIKKKECELKDADVQTLSDSHESIKSFKKSVENIQRNEPKPLPSLNEVIKLVLNQSDGTAADKCLSETASSSVGICVRLILRTVILEAKKIAQQSRRKRLIPDDIDLALSILRIDNNVMFPILKSVPNTDRNYWGRRITRRPPHAISTQLKDYVSEKFSDVPSIREHWLCIEGIQPCVPENVIPSEVKKKALESQEEIQRHRGFGMTIVKRERFLEKRLSKQFFSLEHQVLFNDIINSVASGSPLERKKALQTVESDCGLQFLAGRFVVLIAEGVRVGIGTRNVRALSNLLKLTWSLMKNRRIRLERYLYVLVPALISCVVAKSIVPLIDKNTPLLIQKQKSSSNSDVLCREEEDRLMQELEIEYRIRETSSRLLAHLAEQYASQCLHVRIVQVVRRVFTEKYDVSSIYGVVCTLFAFGLLTIKSILIPNLHDIFCALQSFNKQAQAVTTGPAKSKKVLMEVESKRLDWAKAKVVELIMKILYEYEACEESRRYIDESVFVSLYKEFGSMFYRYIIETGKIDDDGRISINRPSLLRRDTKVEKGVNSKSFSSNYSTNLRSQNLDEGILDELLDDSHRPWAEIARKIDEDTNTTKSNPNPTETKFFGRARLVLIRKSPKTRKAEYMRPIEPIVLPTPPTIKRIFGRSINNSKPTASNVPASRSGASQDEQFKVIMSTAKDPSELLRRYLARPDLQSAAATYGKFIEYEDKNRKTLDKLISDAAFHLSNVRIRNALVTQKVSLVDRDEINRGKFLAPTIQRGSQL